MTPNEYRQKHKHCNTCKYKNFSLCNVRNINLPKTKGLFCKTYKAKDFLKEYPKYDTTKS